MIKLVYVVRRRPEFSPEAFRERWLAHGPLVTRLAETIGARRYVQSHTLDTPVNDMLAESRGMGEPFDGITEVWWDSLDDLVAASQTPAGQEAMQQLIDDEREFIDLARSSVFMTEEHPVFVR